MLNWHTTWHYREVRKPVGDCQNFKPSVYYSLLSTVTVNCQLLHNTIVTCSFSTTKSILFERCCSKSQGKLLLLSKNSDENRYLPYIESRLFHRQKTNATILLPRCLYVLWNLCNNNNNTRIILRHHQMLLTVP